MEEGRCYTSIQIVDRPRGVGGPIEVVKRDCGDYIEYSHIGVYFLNDGSVMYQYLVADRLGRNVELKLTWLSREVGAIPVPPLVYRHPTNPPRSYPSDIEQLKREVLLRFDAGFKEACERHGIPYSVGPFQPPPTTISIDEYIGFSTELIDMYAHSRFQCYQLEII